MSSEGTARRRGGAVVVSPSIGDVDVGDVLDFVEAIIGEWGWNPGSFEWDEANQRLNPIQHQESRSQAEGGPGVTLHDAIGQFGTQLATGGRLSGGKDATWESKEAGMDRRTGTTLRAAATSYVERAINETGFQPTVSQAATVDQRFNDEAHSADDVLDVVRRARELYEEEVQA